MKDTVTETRNYFGNLGGRYVADMLQAPLEELEEAFFKACRDESFLNRLAELQADYIGRPTPLLHAENTSRQIGGAQIYIKLEGLANTGAHKINNALGQALLAKRMGKQRIIAETGAGQHGVATAAVCAKFGLDCTVYMGEVDIRRQRPNVYLMELFGANVVAVSSGSRTLKDAVNAALRDWAASFSSTHYLLGSALGPAPYPEMVQYFQSIIGQETADQLAERGLDPSTGVAALVACVGGGSNAIGFFSPFIDAPAPDLVGVEAGGRGPEIGDHAARMNGQGDLGIIQGYKSYFLMDSDGQLEKTHSISAGLDYPGIGPQLAHLGDTGRIRFTSATDSEALEALKMFAGNEGVIFALESAHGGAEALKLAARLPKDKAVVVNMSGRGDKDIFISAKALQPEAWLDFLKHEVTESESEGSHEPE
ncbi:MAG: tryptophan synthase subunit beta [Spirochaetaceae bacterium]|nr:tryptophan synthase subunit beta [Spirochaetaceae bacterium]MCF7939863.1 tryptophan synthase subunit beta [Spirochaetales bacterium]